MSNRKELEAALATAEAECRKSNEDFVRAQVARNKAKAAWDKEVTDRLKTDLDRRRSGPVWNPRFPDRRKADADLSALVKAVADRQMTYLAMSHAEAEWIKAETTMSKAELEWIKAEAKLDSAIAKRDEIIDALDELDTLGSDAWSSAPIGTRSKHLRDAVERGDDRSTDSTKLVEYTVLDESTRLQGAYGQKNVRQRFSIDLWTQVLKPGRAFGSSPILRQTVGLLGLTGAYLQYYFLDVQLQILNLPSVFPSALQ